MKTTALSTLLAAAVLLPGAAAADASKSVPSDLGRVHQNVAAVFPVRMTNQGIKHGEATMVLEIDPAGRIADELVTGYTRREFADEMVRAVHQWTFEPGMVDGRPITGIFSIKLEFNYDGILVYERHLDSPAPDPGAERQLTYFAHGPDSLDQKPAAVRSPAPVFASEWLAPGRAGRVTLRFYIDETGRVRVPMIASCDDTRLASCAIAAVRQWQFETPRRNGEPVLAFAEQSFVFQPAVAETKS